MCRLKMDNASLPMINNLYKRNETDIKEANLVDFELYKMKKDICKAENVALEYPGVFEKIEE